MDDNSLDLASGIAAFEAKQFAKAQQLLSPLATSGNAEAQYELGLLYQHGNSDITSQNSKNAYFTSFISSLPIKFVPIL